MASRRMFSLEVVDSDTFLDMPATARLLYYDLGMRADDDGFITPIKVMRLTNASADDLKILAAKQLVFLFEDGVMVILHWRRNNKLDASKYTSSIYFPRLKSLEKEGSYFPTKTAGRPKISSGSEPKRVPKGSLKGPLKGPEKGPQYSIGKDSIGEVSTDTPKPPKGEGVEAKIVIDESHPMIVAWERCVGTKLHNKLKENVAAAESLKEKFGRDDFVELLKSVRYIRGDKYAGVLMYRAVVNYIQLEKNIEQVEAYMQGKRDMKVVSQMEGNMPRGGIAVI